MLRPSQGMTNSEMLHQTLVARGLDRQQVTSGASYEERVTDFILCQVAQTNQQAWDVTVKPVQRPDHDIIFS